MADDMERESQVQFTNRHRSNFCCGNSRYYCNKCCLLIYVIIYLFVGIGLLGVGLWIEIERRKYSVLNNLLALPVALLIFVGLFIILSAFCGIIGTVKESPTLLKLYICITVVSLMVQVTIGVMAFIYRQQIPSILSSQLMFAIRGYTDNPILENAVDSLQSTYKCCGFSSLQDYEENRVYSCVISSGFNGTCGVPYSCCESDSETVVGSDSTCGYDTRRPNNAKRVKIYATGCTSSFTDWLILNIDIVGATALGSAIPQLLGIALAYFYIRGAEDRKCWYTVSDYVNGN